MLLGLFATMFIALDTIDEPVELTLPLPQQQGIKPLAEHFVVSDGANTDIAYHVGGISPSLASTPHSAEVKRPRASIDSGDATRLEDFEHVSHILEDEDELSVGHFIDDDMDAIFEPNTTPLSVGEFIDVDELDTFIDSNRPAVSIGEFIDVDELEFKSDLNQMSIGEFIDVDELDFKDDLGEISIGKFIPID